MSALTNRRTAWNVAETIRRSFFLGDSAHVDMKGFNSHLREARVLAMAESIVTYGDDRAAALMPTPDAGEVAEAKALATAA